MKRNLKIMILYLTIESDIENIFSKHFKSTWTSSDKTIKMAFRLIAWARELFFVINEMII